MGGFGRFLKLAIVGGRQHHSKNKEHGENHSKRAFATNKGSNHKHKSTQRSQIQEPLHDQPTVTLYDDNDSASATEVSIITSRAVIYNDKGMWALLSGVYEASDEVGGEQLQPVVSARSISVTSSTSSSAIRKLAASRIRGTESATSSSKRSKTAGDNSKAQQGEGKEAISRGATSASGGLSAVFKSETFIDTAAKTITHSRWEDFWFGMQNLLCFTDTFHVWADLGEELDPDDTGNILSEDESKGIIMVSSSDVGELSRATRYVAASTSAAAACDASSRDDVETMANITVASRGSETMAGATLASDNREDFMMAYSHHNMSPAYGENEKDDDSDTISRLTLEEKSLLRDRRALAAQKYDSDLSSSYDDDDDDDTHDAQPQPQKKMDARQVAQMQRDLKLLQSELHAVLHSSKDVHGAGLARARGPMRQAPTMNSNRNSNGNKYVNVNNKKGGVAARHSRSPSPMRDRHRHRHHRPT
jgi:hypothetical protein